MKKTTLCPRCGSCCTTPLAGLAHHCNTCHRDFGFTAPQQAEAQADDICELFFYIGGHFGPSYEIWISADRYQVETTNAEPRLHPGPTGFRHSATRFKRLVRQLYRHYHLADWNPEYTDSDTMDGTQWELRLLHADGRKERHSGSNAYPPHFRRLLRSLAPYIRAEGFQFHTGI